MALLLMRTTSAAVSYTHLVKLPLIGSYQPRNAAVAITALRVLRGRGWNIPEEAIRRGLETVSWPGRFELLRHTCLLYTSRCV